MVKTAGSIFSPNISGPIKRRIRTKYPPPFPLAHYKLNGDADDSSGHGLHGTANGGSYIAGKVGQAWDNEGNSRILVPYSALLYPGDNFTIAAWINLQTLTYAENVYALSFYDTADKRQWALYTLSGTSQPWRIMTSPNGTAMGTDSFAVTPQTGWHHVALTCANAIRAWKLSIDGELAASITATYTFANQGSHFTFGGLAGGNYLDAMFDDTRLYNAILSDRQIRSLYNFGNGTEENGF